MYIQDNKINCLKVILSCIISAVIGGFVVVILRRMCKKTLEVKKLAALCYILPIAVYIILNATVVYGMCDRVVADAFSFGIAIGIVLTLSRKPIGPNSVRLIVNGIPGYNPSIVWLNSADISLRDAITTIATELSIEPENRVCIESGQGSFLDKMDKPLINQLPHGMAANKTDFFGFSTCQCHLYIKDPTPTEEIKNSVKDDLARPSKFTLQKDTAISSSSNIIMSARINDNSQYKFTISNVNGFAAAAPQMIMGKLQKAEVLRMLPFCDYVEDDESVSDASSIASRSPRNRGFWGKLFSRQLYTPPPVMSHEPITDGAQVVLEDAVGRYMNLEFFGGPYLYIMTIVINIRLLI